MNGATSRSLRSCSMVAARSVIGGESTQLIAISASVELV